MKSDAVAYIAIATGLCALGGLAFTQAHRDRERLADPAASTRVLGTASAIGALMAGAAAAGLDAPIIQITLGTAFAVAVVALAATFVPKPGSGVRLPSPKGAWAVAAAGLVAGTGVLVLLTRDGGENTFGLDPVVAHVFGTCANWSCGLNRRAAPNGQARKIGTSYQDGERIELLCRRFGGLMTASPDKARSRVWYRARAGGWVNDLFVSKRDDSVHERVGVPACPPGVS